MNSRAIADHGPQLGRAVLAGRGRDGPTEIGRLNRARSDGFRPAAFERRRAARLVRCAITAVLEMVGKLESSIECEQYYFFDALTDDSNLKTELHDGIRTDFLLFAERLAEALVEENIDGELVGRLLEPLPGAVHRRFDPVAQLEI